jgi:L-amino acid N-acyltransferase YncA
VSSTIRASNDRLLVREAAAGDLPAILDVYDHEVVNSTATFDLREQTLDQRSAWLAEHLLAIRWSWQRLKVGSSGARAFRAFRAKLAYSKSVESSVYVPKDCRARGVGSALMTTIVRRAIELGYHAIIAAIVPPNEASVRLHERLGFELIGSSREVGFKFGTWQDVEFYQLLPSQTPSGKA